MRNPKSPRDGIEELEPHAVRRKASPIVPHVALARAESFDDRAHRFLRRIDHEELDGSTDRRRFSRVMTWGRESANSYPSRRIVSTRIARCSSPRPEHPERVRLARLLDAEATFVSSSLSSRSFRCRLVTYFPTRSGERRVVDAELHGEVGSSTR